MRRRSMKMVPRLVPPPARQVPIALPQSQFDCSQLPESHSARRFALSDFLQRWPADFDSRLQSLVLHFGSVDSQESARQDANEATS